MEDSKNYFPKLCIKINNTIGGSDLIPIKLSGQRASRVFVHSKDPGIDIAVIPASDIPILPAKGKGDYRFKAVSTSLLATKEHFVKGTTPHIQEGDETFF